MAKQISLPRNARNWIGPTFLMASIMCLPSCSTIYPHSSNGLGPEDGTTKSAPDKSDKANVDIIIVAMPGGAGFIGNLVTKLTAFSFQAVANNISVIGDGVRSITLEEINDGLDEAMAKSKVSGNNVTGIITSRGEALYGTIGVVSNYHSDFHPSGEEIIPFEQLIRSFIRASKSNLNSTQKTGLYIGTCYAGAALWHADILPENFSIAANVHWAGIADPWDQTRLFKGLSKDPAIAGDLSPEALVKAFLVSQSNYDNPPMLYVAGKGFYDPYATVLNKIGKPFSQDEKKVIDASLAPYFNKVNINKTLLAISEANELSDLDDVFGCAMSVGMALAIPSPNYVKHAPNFRNLVTTFAINHLKVNDGVPLRPLNSMTVRTTYPVCSESVNFWATSIAARQQCGM